MKKPRWAGKLNEVNAVSAGEADNMKAARIMISTATKINGRLDEDQQHVIQQLQHEAKIYCDRDIKVVTFDRGTKGPTETGWGLKATSDITAIKLDRPVNIGLLLGPESGIVDIEIDDPNDPEVREIEERYLIGVETPTYQSKKGKHRLFRFDERIRATGITRVKGPIDFRFNANGGQVQSAAPPSLHESLECHYRWISGLSIHDLDGQFADVPDALIDIALERSNQKPGNRRTQKLADDVLAGKPIKADNYRDERKATKILTTVTRDGDGRHDNLRDLATFFWGEKVKAWGIGALDRDDIYSEVLATLLNHNSNSVVPPHSPDKVERECESARRYIQTKKLSERNCSAPIVVATENDSGEVEEHEVPGHGFAYDEVSDTFSPGEWRCEIITSDPQMVRLYPPMFSKEAPSVDLAISQFNDSKFVREIVQERAQIDLEQEPGWFKKVWSGKAARGRNAGRPGVSKTLFEAAKRIPPDPDTDRSQVIKQYILDWCVRVSGYNHNGGISIREVWVKSLSVAFDEETGDCYFQFRALMNSIKFDRLGYEWTENIVKDVCKKNDWYRRHPVLFGKSKARRYIIPASDFRETFD